MTSLIWSCSDDDTDPRIPASDSTAGTTSITITNPESGGYDILTEVTASNVWETFIWESLNNVNTAADYYIQIDNQSGDFSEPALIGPFSPTTTAVEVTEEMINNALIGLGYYTPELVNAQARIYQEINEDYVYYSAPITFDVVGYGGEDPDAIPTLWAVGAGLPTAGWGWNSPVVLQDLNKEGIYKTATPVEFTSDGDANFRFFAQTDFNPTSYNYPYYEEAGYTIDAKLENANDDDSNFKFVGESGEYIIIIDENAKTITLSSGILPGTNIVPTPPELPLLYNPGGHQGWSPENTYQLTSKDSDGIFSGYVRIKKDDEFKFTPEPNWDNSYGTEDGAAGTSGTITLNGGDNIKFSGDEGAYLFIVDTNANTWEATSTTWTATTDSWGVIGSATPTGWGSDTDMVFNEVNGLLELELSLVEGELKFRPNDDWPGNYGDNGFDGLLEIDGGNIPIAEAGTYKITLDLRDPNRVTYKIVSQ